MGNDSNSLFWLIDKTWCCLKYNIFCTVKIFDWVKSDNDMILILGGVDPSDTEDRNIPG